MAAAGTVAPKSPTPGSGDENKSQFAQTNRTGRRNALGDLLCEDELTLPKEQVEETLKRLSVALSRENLVVKEDDVKGT